RISVNRSRGSCTSMRPISFHLISLRPCDTSGLTNSARLFSLSAHRNSHSPIDPDRQRHVRPRQFFPISLAPLDEESLLIAKLILQPLRYNCGTTRRRDGTVIRPH